MMALVFGRNNSSLNRRAVITIVLKEKEEKRRSESAYIAEKESEKIFWIYKKRYDQKSVIYTSYVVHL